MAKKAIRISAKGLADALPGQCRRCFWISLRYDLPFQTPWPGIFNSIDSYTKKVVHRYFDDRRKLPKWYPKIGHASDYIRDTTLLHHSRFQITDPQSNVTLTGTPDDILRLKDDSYHIVDYKTARFTEAQDELYPTYEVQLNGYAYIGKRIGFTPISGLSLIYMEPDTDSPVFSDEKTSLGFTAKVRPVKLQPEKLIPPLLRSVRQQYDKATPPKRTSGCEDCEKLEELIRAMGQHPG